MFTDLNCEGQYGHCFNEPSFVVVVELGPEGVGPADAAPEAVESVPVAWPVPDMVSGGAEAGRIGTGDVEPKADESIAAVAWPVPEMVTAGAKAGWIGTEDVEPEAVESVAVGWPVPDMVTGGVEAGDVEPEADESIAAVAWPVPDPVTGGAEAWGNNANSFKFAVSL